MSKIKVKGIKQLVDGTTQPLSIGGVLEDNSDEVLNIAPNGDLQVKKVIQQENWIAPTLLNSWVNYSVDDEICGYMKDSMGFVHIRGLLKNGTIGQPIFVLPIGYRPSKNNYYATVCNSLFGHFVIKSDGNVYFASGSNVWSSLSGATFKAV